MKGNREKQIINISILGIIANLILAGVKIIIGVMSGSIAITSDAVNNLTDSSTALITIIGTKLAQKKPDKNHPFGFGRVEYLTSMIIGIIVLVTGFEMGLSSIKGIFNPSAVDYSWVILIVLFITVIVKTFLAAYIEKQGRKLNSGALIASGKEAKNDVLISVVTIISALVYMFTKLSIDSYAGLFISIFILKTGFLKCIKDLFENKNNLEVNSSKTFREFYTSKTAAQLKNDLDEVYYSKLRQLNLKDASFGYNGCKEFLGAIELALFEKQLKPYIEQGIENVFTRDWGPFDFSEFMDEVVEKYSSITIDEWNESYIYFEKNHSWLAEHPCASQEVAEKRFEFLREGKCTPEEIMLEEVDNMIKIIERYLGNQKK